MPSIAAVHALTNSDIATSIAKENGADRSKPFATRREQPLSNTKRQLRHAPQDQTSHSTLPAAFMQE
jgi:hypothetical protein